MFAGHVSRGPDPPSPCNSTILRQPRTAGGKTPKGETAVGITVSRNAWFVAVFVAGVLALTTPAGAVVFGFTASLNGSQEAPPVMTDVTGVAALDYDATTRLFSMDLYIVGLTTQQVTAAHIHEGPKAVNGAIAYDFGDGSLWYASGDGIRLTVIGAEFPAASEAALLRGDAYVNVHSVRYPGGEVRGQLEKIGEVMVPEPSSLLLVSAAVISLAFRRRIPAA